MFSPPDYSATENFVRPQLGPWTAFLYLHRKPILQAVLDASAYLCGDLLDVGCGNKPYASVLRCKRYIGVDVLTSPYNRSSVDVVYGGDTLPFGNAEFDSVLCTEVLEHARSPRRLAHEIARVLKPGGYALLTAPMFMQHHEEPCDFHRFTRHGMANLASQARLDVVWIQARGGVYSTALAALYLMQGRTGVRRPLADLVLWLLWPFAKLAIRIDAKSRDAVPLVSLGWQMLTRKPLG